jgi:DNA-binding transcriptional MerR regulator
MYKIGEFSKMMQVSVGTLRHYDRIGLLKPVEVDKFTGYRSYSAEQLPQLHRIIALKDLGFSLEQIMRLVEDGITTKHLEGMLMLRRTQLNQEIEEMRNQLAEVERRLHQIEKEDILSGYDVIVKQVEPLLVASVRAILPNHSASATLFREVYEALGEHALQALGPNPGEGGTTMVLWYDTEFKETDIDGAAAFIVKCRVPESGRMRIHELPPYMMASTIHHGTYNTIGNAHEAIITWIEGNNYRIVGADREVDIYNKMPIRFDDPSYITEIQYPIEKIN